MKFTPQIFKEIKTDELCDLAKNYIEEGWRFVQICGTVIEGGVEILYSFARDEEMENLVLNVENDAEVPSITEYAIEAFFFENETKELFGINFSGIALDYNRRFYKLSIPTPMNPHSKSAVNYAKRAYGIDVSEEDEDIEVARVKVSAKSRRKTNRRSRRGAGRKNRRIQGMRRTR